MLSLQPHHRRLWNAVLLALIMLPVGTLILAIMQIWDKARGCRVFCSFWASGRAALEGGNPFARHELTWVVRIPGQAGLVDLNLNPPAVLPLFEGLARLDPQPAATLWAVISFAILAASIAAIPTSNEKRVWLATSSAIIDTLLLGQIYALLLALGVLMVLAIKAGRRELAAVTLGVLIAFKPNFALALPLLLAGGELAFLAIATATAAAITLISLAGYGTEMFGWWLGAVRADNHWIFSTTVSLPSYFARIGFPLAGFAAAAMTGFGLMIWTFLRKPGLVVTLEVGLIAAMLCSPLCWMHYTLVLAPFMAVRQWTYPMMAGAWLLWIPQHLLEDGMLGTWLQKVVLGGVYTVGLGLVLLAIARPLEKAGQIARLAA